MLLLKQFLLFLFVLFVHILPPFPIIHLVRYFIAIVGLPLVAYRYI